MSNITMIGTGYIGLVTGTLFADKGNNVTCVDKNQEIVELLNSGKIHIFEPGLEELVKKNKKENRIKFTKKLDLSDSEFIFLGVNTPSNKEGSFNLEYLLSAARDIGRALRNVSGYKIIICKSTVPQGTHKLIEEIITAEIQDNGKLKWDYVSNPETLAEGTAVRDFAKPDRIIIGTNSDKAFQKMKLLYHPFIKNDIIMRGTPSDAELAKLMSNTVLASRVATANEFARIADITPGADADIIRKMVCEDERIGYNFMFPSPGYGGSCFPKDIQGLVNQSKIDGYNPLLLSQIHKSNEEHKKYTGERISTLLNEIKNPTIGIWGITFKPNTDDMRDAASIPIISGLINRGANVIVYDPQDSKAKEIFGDKVTFVNSQYDAVKNADALILMTEWSCFDSIDYNRLKKNMKGNYLFDLRNRWNPKDANNAEFTYVGMGRYYPFFNKK
ncbi:MAG: UDP-glucose/GDP-mannose dehydrogenase family protein [Nanoarchaeota archaeon]|nr:UDP-glucose/GDP-mannose dehydrogenase family protein [Nanoarchaeota archaeon]